jgi:diguanylate cyclase (GGDEF)-like protein
LQSAERIRSVIAEEVFSTGGSNIVVTISIGATVLSSSTVSAMEILAIADTALYAAKTNGRNQTALRLPQLQAAVHADPEMG